MGYGHHHFFRKSLPIISIILLTSYQFILADAPANPRYLGLRGMCLWFLETLSGTKHQYDSKWNERNANKAWEALIEKHKGVFVMGDQKSFEQLNTLKRTKLEPGNGRYPVYRVSTSKGKTEVIIAISDVPSFRVLTNLDTALQRLKRWSDEGRGAPIKKVIVRRQKDKLQVAVIVQDFNSDSLYGKVQHANNASKPEFLNRFSESTRVWVKNGILKMLDHHHDPHLGNVMYRVTLLRPGVTVPKNKFTRVEGQYLIELINVDPFPSKIYEPRFRQNRPEGYPTDVYSREWQNEQLRIALNL